MKYLTIFLGFTVFITSCYKCPGDSGYSPQCGPKSAQQIRK